jgi:anti-sigma factor RsiW
MTDTCTSLREALLDRADGRATPGQLRAVEQHLPVCAACRATAARLGAPDAPFALGDVTVPPALLEEMRDDLHRRLDALPPAPSGGGGLAWLDWRFGGTVAIPKPLAWGALAALLVLWAGIGERAGGPRPAATARPEASAPTARRAPPAPAALPVLRDGVDRLPAIADTAQI